MSNRKLYMLKVACARLHGLKVQERRYKGALVKRACMHLLTKQAYKGTYENKNAVPYDRADSSDIANWEAKADWNSGFWGTALGKFLRPYFENQEHYNAYAKLLTKFRHKRGLERERAQRALLEYYGVDPKKYKEIMDLANAWSDDYGNTVISNGQEESANVLKSIESQMSELQKQLSDAQAEYKRYGGKLPDDKDDRRGHSGYDGPGWLPRSSGYLTDQQAMYDPEFGRAWGLGRRGTVINNYYYGADGKRHDTPPDAGKPSDPSKPGATTPGPDPNPDLPGLSAMLGISDPGSSYLSGQAIDPKKISLSIGANQLTTTGDPAIDLGTGSISIDPASLPPIDYLATPSKPAEPLPATLSAIEKGRQIAGDLVGIIPGGNEAVDRGADWFKGTYNNSSDWVKEVADTGVTALGDLSGTPKASDPTNPLYIPSISK